MLAFRTKDHRLDAPFESNYSTLPTTPSPPAARPGPGTPQAAHLKPRGFMEHRWGHRHAADLTVSFALKSGKRGVGRVLNISTTGAYLQTDMDLRILTLIDITIIDGAVSRIAPFTACVMRRDESGVGLEWQARIRLPKSLFAHLAR